MVLVWVARALILFESEWPPWLKRHWVAPRRKPWIYVRVFLLLFFIFLVFSPWAFMGSEVLSGDQSLNTFSYKWIRLSGAISFSSRSAWHGDLDVNDWKWKLIKQTCPQGRQLCFVHSWRTPCWSAVPEASPCSLSMSDVSSLGKNKKCTLCIRCK